MAGIEKVIPWLEWGRKTSLKFFEKYAEALHLDMTIDMANDMPRRVLAQSFEAVSRDTYYISVMARQILTENVSGKVYQEDEIFKPEQIIVKAIESAKAALDNRILQSDQKLQGAGYSREFIKGRPDRLGIPIYTSAARGYMEVCLAADLYGRMMTGLELIGELSDRQDQSMMALRNAARETRTTMNTLASTISHQFSIINRICNGAVEQRRKEREVAQAKALEKQKSKGEAKAAQREQALGKKADAAARTAGRLAAAQAELGEAGPLGVAPVGG